MVRKGPSEEVTFKLKSEWQPFTCRTLSNPQSQELVRSYVIQCKFRMRIFSCVTTQHSLEYWNNLVEWWVIPSMVRSYAIILPELIHDSVEYKVPMTLVLFDWKRPQDVGLMASAWLHQVTPSPNNCAIYSIMWLPNTWKWCGMWEMEGPWWRKYNSGKLPDEFWKWSPQWRGRS